MVHWLCSLFFAGVSGAWAHAPDTSYLRAVVSQHELELRFTFDLSTLHRIDRVDSNLDGKVSRGEAEAAVTDLAAFLRRTVTLEINNDKVELGTPQPLGWPVDVGDAVEEKDYGQTLVHLTFISKSDKLIEDFYLLYEVFGQLGSMHRAVADIDQEGKHLEVVFTELEPDYVYDTFWKPDGEVVARHREVPIPVEFFRSSLTLTWNLAGLPLMFLAAFSLMPRKLPWVVIVATLLWYGLDLLDRSEKSIEPTSWSQLMPATVLGLFAAMLVCALMMIPLSLLLRRWIYVRWFTIVAWLSLIYGGLYVTGATFSCRVPG